MRIAYFSPLPPKKTGIANYSRHLAAALHEVAEVHLFDANIPPGAGPATPAAVDFVTYPDALLGLGEDDVCLYHLGNNPWYHLDIYKVLLRKPGVVVLHDTVLYFLIAGLGVGGMIKEFGLNYGIARLPELGELLETCPDGDVLRYPHPERFPFLFRALAHARAIVVHSQAAAAKVRQAGYRRDVHVIPLLCCSRTDAAPPRHDPQELRAQLGLADNDIIVGAFGFIDPTKRLVSLLRALDRARGHHPLKLLIVGEGEDPRIQGEIKRRRLEAMVLRLGFVDDQAFECYLALTDIVVNLRYPSMGESSATLIQAFAEAKPCVVTDDAWFSELPDSCVWKIRHGPQEVDDLAAALRALARDPSLRRRLGDHARRYVGLHCAPQQAAQKYLDVIRQVGLDGDGAATRNGEPDRGADTSRGRDEPDRDWVERYLLARTLAAIPTPSRADD